MLCSFFNYYDYFCFFLLKNSFYTVVFHYYFLKNLNLMFNFLQAALAL